jgi:hypothetical protein
VEEGILDVELMDRLASGDGEGEDGSNGGELDDGAEGLIVVYFEALSETPKNPTALVVVEGAYWGQLMAKETLVGDHVGAWWTQHQVPGVVSGGGRPKIKVLPSANTNMTKNSRYNLKKFIDRK